MQTATRVARLATGYGERCPSPPHTVDCSLVDGALRAQRERCVNDERDCRVPHKLVTTYDYSRQGVWRVREREERLAAAGRKAARIARAGARGGARAAAGEAAAVAGVVGATGRAAARLAKAGAAGGARAAAGAATVAIDASKAGASAAGAGAEVLARTGKESLDFGARKAREALGNFARTYAKLMEVDDDLPDETDKRWKDPRAKTDLLQTYLALKFDVPRQSLVPDVEFCGRVLKASSSARCDPSPAAAAGKHRAVCAQAPATTLQLERYQQALIAPLARVDELLIVSGTGTGKSQMYMQALAVLPYVRELLAAPDPAAFDIGGERYPRCYIICPDKQKAYAQFADELCKAPGWQSVRDRMHKFVSLADQPRNQLINFVAYTTAGNICKKAGATADGKGMPRRSELDNAIIVMDEVHVRVTLQDVHPTQVRGGLGLAQWLRLRRYRKFLALPASPPVRDCGRLTTLLNYFMPAAKRLAVTEQVQPLQPGSSIRALVVKRTELDDFVDVASRTADETECRVRPKRSLQPAIKEKLRGLNVCMYTSDRDGARFPVFEYEPPRLVRFDVGDIVARPVSKSKKEYAAALTYQHDRYRKIAKAWAPALGGSVAKQYAGLDPTRKTLIFVSQHDSATQVLADALNLNLRKRGAAPVRVLLKKFTPGHVKKTLREFNCAASGGCIVANTQFATGLDYVGVVELHQLLPVGAELDYQLAGRARRFCSHGALPGPEWKIRHFVWQPDPKKVDPKGATKTSCERVLADYVESEKRVLDDLLATLWEVSFTKKCFHRNPPKVVQTSENHTAARRGWLEEWAAQAKKWGYAVGAAGYAAFTPTLLRRKASVTSEQLRAAVLAELSETKPSEYGQRTARNVREGAERRLGTPLDEHKKQIKRLIREELQASGA